MVGSQLRYSMRRVGLCRWERIGMERERGLWKGSSGGSWYRPISTGK